VWVKALGLTALRAPSRTLFHAGSLGVEGQQHLRQGSGMQVSGSLKPYRVRRAPESRILLLVLPVLLGAIPVGFLAHSQHAAGD
jgi:hypothetical protein